jgi:uncharacterized protein
MARPKHVPQRSCVVCRQKQDKRQLIRLARQLDGQAVVDPTGKQNGRGAYLCQNPACWEKALRTDILNKALQMVVTAENKNNLAAQYAAHSAAHKLQNP